MKKFKLFSISFSCLLISTNIYAANCPNADWGSDVTFADLPSYISKTDLTAPTAIVLGPTVGENPGDLCKFTAGGDTNDLHNGKIDVYAFREPYTLSKVCDLDVEDWSSGSFSTTHHYCVYAHGGCSITGNNDGKMVLQLKGYETQNLNTQAGNC